MKGIKRELKIWKVVFTTELWLSSGALSGILGIAVLLVFFRDSHPEYYSAPGFIFLSLWETIVLLVFFSLLFLFLARNLAGIDVDG